MAKASKLINDLSNVPSIIGALGIDIAEAQKALNLDYLDNLERLLAILESLLHPRKEDGTEVSLNEENRKVVAELVKQLAPSRYQFTETTLAVKLDLAQTLDASFAAGVNATTVTAAMAVGFGYDYRAAAEVKTVLHAIPASEQTLATLLARAEKVNDKMLTLPDAKKVDKAIIEKSHETVAKLLGVDKLKEPEVNSVVEKKE